MGHQFHPARRCILRTNATNKSYNQIIISVTSVACSCKFSSSKTATRKNKTKQKQKLTETFIQDSSAKSNHCILQNSTMAIGTDRVIPLKFESNIIRAC